MKHCKKPDKDFPKMVCGHPLPCPWHTVIIEDGVVTLPPVIINPEVLIKLKAIAKALK
jgi:hypothetical protein